MPRGPGRRMTSGTVEVEAGGVHRHQAQNFDRNATECVGGGEKIRGEAGAAGAKTSSGFARFARSALLGRFGPLLK